VGLSYIEKITRMKLKYRAFKEELSPLFYIPLVDVQVLVTSLHCEYAKLSNSF
jgi:hypothetical protein